MDSASWLQIHRQMPSDIFQTGLETTIPKISARKESNARQIDPNLNAHYISRLNSRETGTPRQAHVNSPQNQCTPAQGRNRPFSIVLNEYY